VLTQVRTAFPNLVEWEFCNEADDDHSDFTIWGCLTIREDDEFLLQRRFYITFDLYKEQWQGVLTIGQHNYLWTSADFGDAHLLNTSRCSDLGIAIAALKEQIAAFTRAFSVS
jgi:hypothetical protein